MSLKRISELIGVSRLKSSLLNSIRFVNMTRFNDLNLKLRDLREENPSILISSGFIPIRSFKEIKTFYLETNIS